MICLGVDIGGTGCKCAAFDERGVQHALSYAEYTLAAGTSNLPPDMLYRAVMCVMDDCCKQLPTLMNVAAITISSFGESFVSVDAQGKPLSDILMYFGNAESEDFSELVRRVGAERFMRIARIMPDASYSLAKMCYTLKNARKPVYKFLFIASYLCFCLTGKSVCDESLACRSLLYDVEKHCWSDELLDLCGIAHDLLPEVLPTGSIAGTILPDLAETLGLPRTVQIVIGSHDQIVNALGAGVCRPGDAVDTSGTCECITPLFSKIPKGLDFQKNNFACVPYLQTGGYVTYAYNISAGSVVRWYRDALGGIFRREAERSATDIYDVFNRDCPAEPSNLLVLPFLQGMGGTPQVNPSTTGLIAGLTTQTRLSDIYRAILEGITFEMHYNQDALAENGVTFERLYACGGGARSNVWLQIKADILGCEIVRVETEETGAMGSAILGFAAVTGESPLKIASHFVRYGKHFVPNSANQAIYERQYAQYCLLRDFYTKSERYANK